MAEGNKQKAEDAEQVWITPRCILLSWQEVHQRGYSIVVVAAVVVTVDVANLQSP